MQRQHHNLIVWQQGIALVKLVYRLTAKFPSAEAFGLTGQMRRAAVSVPANIAEAVGRAGPKERLHFLGIARGSLNELDTYVVIAKELGYLGDAKDLQTLTDRVFGLIGGLINAERRTSAA